MAAAKGSINEGSALLARERERKDSDGYVSQYSEGTLAHKLDKFFLITQRGSSINTELRAGTGRAVCV